MMKEGLLRVDSNRKKEQRNNLEKDINPREQESRLVGRSAKGDHFSFFIILESIIHVSA